MNKKITLLSFLCLLASVSLWSQTGATCATPDVVTVLPYTATGLTTSGAGNDYLGTACSSDYLSGEDYIFTYTPTSNQVVDITLSNTGFGTGIFVLDSCPDLNANCIDYAESATGNPAVTGVSLTSGTTYYIIVSTYDFMSSNPNTAFDIEIIELIQNDAGIVEISGTESGCGLSNTETVTVSIHNFGLVAMSNFGVSFKVNNGAAVTETVTTNIDPDSTLVYTFTGTADLSTASTLYEIKAYTELTGDGNDQNDTLALTVANQPSVNTFPYVEGFESGNGWWIASGANSTWELGTPAAPTINSAASGVNSWATNLIGNHATSEVSELISPCFDLTALAKPKITMDIWYETTMILGSVTLLYSADNGANWDTLTPGSSSTNWFSMGNVWSGSSAAWMNALNTVPYLAGAGNVQFKLAFNGGLIAGEGVAIDNFSIEDCATADPVAGFSYVINGNDVTFTNSSTGATSYYWDFDEILATSTDADPTHNYLLAGSYNVTLIAMNECGSDTIIQVVDIVTGLSELSDQNMRVYPNPANDYLIINGIDLINANYEILDVNGKLCVSNMMNDKMISLESLESGIYFLKIQTEDQLNISRFVIQK